MRHDGIPRRLLFLFWPASVRKKPHEKLDTQIAANVNPYAVDDADLRLGRCLKECVLPALELLSLPLQTGAEA